MEAIQYISGHFGHILAGCAILFGFFFFGAVITLTILDLARDRKIRQLREIKELQDEIRYEIR